MIEEKFKEAGVEYKIDTEEFSVKSQPFFRRSDISPKYLANDQRREENKKKIDDVVSSFIHAHHFASVYRHKAIHYHAYYKMEKDFDIKKLNGRLAFQEGMLIESTIIRKW